jgi:hypothetical protein
MVATTARDDMSKGNDDAAPVVKFGPPLKPRKGLVVALTLGFVLWSVALWVMYFTTVYPNSHRTKLDRSTTRPAEEIVPRQ